MSLDRPKLSVLMITLNEERLLGRVLESVEWADEIVIVDSGSTDSTAEIAKSYTDRFYVLPYEGHGIMRQHTLARSKGEWILYIDADEIVTPELARSIREAMAATGGFAGYRMQLHTYFLGKWFGKRGWRREWKTRLFRRECGSFNAEPIHEGAAITGKIGTLDGVILHYPYRNVEHAVEKMNRYSTAGAETLRARGKRVSAAGAALRGTSRFFRDYLIGGDFLYGRAGLVRSAIMGYYTLLKYTKAREEPDSSAFHSTS